ISERSARRITGRAGFASLNMRSFSESCGSSILSSFRYTTFALSIETVATSVGTSRLFSVLSGSLSSMLCTSAVVVRMKMISSTHARSRSGVMLISATGPLAFGAFISVRGGRLARVHLAAAPRSGFGASGLDVVDHEGGLELGGEVAHVEVQRVDAPV